jgi:hypothetical protein
MTTTYVHDDPETASVTDSNTVSRVPGQAFAGCG